MTFRPICSYHVPHILTRCVYLFENISYGNFLSRRTLHLGKIVRSMMTNPQHHIIESTICVWVGMSVCVSEMIIFLCTLVYFMYDNRAAVMNHNPFQKQLKCTKQMWLMNNDDTPSDPMYRSVRPTITFDILKCDCWMYQIPHHCHHPFIYTHTNGCTMVWCLFSKCLYRPYFKVAMSQ